MDKVKLQKSQYKKDIQEVVQTLDSMRQDPNNPVDVSLGEFIKSKWGISIDALYDDLGINPSIDTIQNIFTMPDYSVRWLVPEIIRDALRLGLRKSPIWADFIVSEQTVANPKVTIPHLNMSEAMPRYVGEAETIPKGTISYGSKDFTIKKMGRGISIPYEVQDYVTIDVMAIFLQDFGVKLNHALDSLLIDVLINGEQADGSESALVMGVATADTLAYKDLLRIWVRMSRIGRSPFGMIGGEDMAMDTLDLAEFKTRYTGTPDKQLDLRTRIPERQAFYIHGAVPTDQAIIVDRASAVIKYNAKPLMVESERIVSNQTMSTYASLTTGFGILYTDGRVILDKSLEIDSPGAGDNNWTADWNVDALEDVTIN